MIKTIKSVDSSGEATFIRYLHAKARKLGFPVSTTFEITSRCNFSCKMCYIHNEECNRHSSEELTADQWLEIGRQAKEAGVVMALITGGEPLIRKDFPEIYSGLKKLGLLISINTNGSLITDEIYELFVNDPPTRLNISLYGASNETYSSLCGGEYFDKVIYNIKRLKEAGIQIKLNMSITPYNCADMEKMLAIASELGLHHKATTYMYPPARRNDCTVGENSGRFTAEEGGRQKAIYDLLRFGKEEFLKRVGNLQLNGYDEDECREPCEGEKMRCRAGTSSCWINHKGEMMPCGMFSTAGYNILENGFADCWQNVKRETALITTPAECIDCKYRSLCPVCAAVCKSETGEFNKVPEYACKFSRASEKYLKELARGLENENC